MTDDKHVGDNLIYLILFGPALFDPKNENVNQVTNECNPQKLGEKEN